MASFTAQRGSSEHLDEITMPYDIQGDPAGAPVVLVAGQGMPRALWQLTVGPALVEAGMRVLCYDARGAGELAGAPGPYSVPQLGDDLSALLDRLGWTGVALCGISLGGMVAEYVAATRADLVSRAVLLASTSVPTAFQLAYARARTASAARPPVSDELQAFLELLITVPVTDLREDTEFARTARTLIGRRGPYGAGFVAQGLAGDAWSIDPLRGELWSEIVAPCLLVAFEHDLLFPPGAVRAAAEVIPGARFALIEDVAHGTALIKACAEISEVIVGFLNG